MRYRIVGMIGRKKFSTKHYYNSKAVAQRAIVHAKTVYPFVKKTRIVVVRKMRG